MTKRASLNPRSKLPSELRYDLVSKDWVVIATGRARRPETFKKEKRFKQEVSKKFCPFCNISTQEKPTLIFSRNKKIPFEAEGKIPDKWTPLENTKIKKKHKGSNSLTGWTTIVIPNKYPAFSPYPSLNPRTEGKLYQRMNAKGFHEVVVTRDHKKTMAQFTIKQVKEVFDVYQARYLSLMKEEFVKYISIFHNHGVEAGASIAHPHSQIITTPLIDTDLTKALKNSQKYFRTHKKCIYCLMNNWERKRKERVVFENKDFLVICPFASKSAFQIIVTPKKHLSNFEQITEEEKWELAEAFGIALNKLYKALNDPAYNFYLHTAPCDGSKYNHYHWHWTILPKTSIWAGFEIGTRMEISTIEPEKAAEYLRKQ